jgi:hypothetical protein
MYNSNQILSDKGLNMIYVRIQATRASSFLK